uniref:Uncharacterized protein n=1 Tax=Anopheles atroparvus TaxID=41427 RepID=A0AAG5DE28_ANOAO
MNNMTQPSHISRALLERTLGYHGKPFQKIWETSRREDELQRIGIGNDPDFAVYTARSKHLTLKDRAKRLKLHQFMVKNADTLFDYALSIKPQRKLQGEYQECTQFAIPPMEVFLGPDTVEKAEQLLKNVQPGDVLYGAVVPKHNHNPNHGITLKPLLIIGNVTYCVRNLSIKATIAPAMMAPSVETVSGLVKSNQTANIIICCEVIDVAADARRLYCSTWRSAKSDRVPASIEYGLVKEDDIPAPYK